MKIFTNVAALKAARLTAGQLVETKGYYDAGDGGQARYLITTDGVADEHGNHTLTNGTVAVLQYEGEIWINWFGASSIAAPNINDAAMAAIKALNLPCSLRGVQGTYQVSVDVELPRDVPILCDGVIFSSSVAGPSGFVNGVVVIDGDDKILLPGLATNMDNTYHDNDCYIDFVSDHNLSVGDVICIYNPTPFSYSSYRNYYRQGEFFTVSKVISSVRVQTDSFPYTAHLAADVQVWKCNMSKTGVVRIGAVYDGGDGGALSAIALRQLYETDVSGVNAKSSGFTALVVSNCFKCIGTGINAHNVDVKATSLLYGMAIYSSQDCTFSGDFTGGRHGVTYTGGGTFNSFSIVNRGCVVKGVFRTLGLNKYAADFHGNTEYCRYEGICHGGVNAAGNHNSVDLIIVNSSDECIAVREPTGFDFDYEIKATVNKIVGTNDRVVWLIDDLDGGVTSGVFKLRGEITVVPEFVNIIELNRRSGVDYGVDVSGLVIKGTAPTNAHVWQNTNNSAWPKICTPEFRGVFLWDFPVTSVGRTSTAVTLPWKLDLDGSIKANHFLSPRVALTGAAYNIGLRNIGDDTFTIRIEPFGTVNAQSDAAFYYSSNVNELSQL